jgi:hypothetical protein
MITKFRPGDRVRFTAVEIARYPWLARGVIRFVNRCITWRVVDVFGDDGESVAVQFDSVKHDIKDPTVLPTDMFEHVTPGLRERLQRMRL